MLIFIDIITHIALNSLFYNSSNQKNDKQISSTNTIHFEIK